MDVDVQIHGAAETLEDGDAAALGCGHPAVSGPAAQVSLDCSMEDSRHGATQIVAPCEEIANPVRQRQDPLPDRHVGEHLVDEVRGTLCHPSTVTARTESAPFAGEGDQLTRPALRAAEPREAASQEPAP